MKNIYGWLKTKGRFVRIAVIGKPQRMAPSSPIFLGHCNTCGGAQNLLMDFWQ
jgi:hypothetical protein